MTGMEVKCWHCNERFYRRPSEGPFCSMACAHAAKTVHPKLNRTCKKCGKSFMWNAKPASNSSGNYCSLACRNAGYVGFYRGRPAGNLNRHRPGWSSVSRKFRKRGNDFCAMCGKETGRLAVHHVEKYWVGKDNSDINLITLCPKHHAKMEAISERISLLAEPQRKLVVMVIQGMLGDRICLLQGMRLERQRIASVTELHS